MKNFSKHEKVINATLLIMLVFFIVFHFRHGSESKTTDIPSIPNEEQVTNWEDEEDFLYLELAKTDENAKEQIITHSGYTTSYNSDWLIPNWVAWELTKEEVEGTEKRPSQEFKPDPKVIGKSAVHKDYTNSGYARGHMFPAADGRISREMMLESFYLSNVCPQNSSLNSGVWLRLEDKCRRLAKEYGKVWICAGPIMEEGHSKIGRNDVAVPVGFFKVICLKNHEGNWQGIGFVFSNLPNKNTNMFDQTVTIDEVEKIYTHHDFFYNLPDSIETEIERQKNIKDWQ